jgi:L-rhamnose-H+ transport protein
MTRLELTRQIPEILHLPAGIEIHADNIVTSNNLQALLLVLCAAVMNAAYALPMKLNKKWAWEHSWFAFSVFGVAVVPTLIALLTVPGLWSTYASVSAGTLAAMVVFGACWGVSLVFFGLALTRLGVAITFAVCLGTSAAVGALTPLVAQHANMVMTRQGALIFLGVFVILLGVALCGLAGRPGRQLCNASLRPRGRGFSADFCWRSSREF